MKNKITKKRTNIVPFILEKMAGEDLFKETTNLELVVVKNSFYHSRLYLALRDGEQQVAHIILSRKKDYILKVVVDVSWEKKVDMKVLRKYFEKTFPCKAQNFVTSFSPLAYSEQHPNDILSKNAV